LGQHIVLEEASLFKNPNKQVWQFPVQNNRSRFADDGITYFKARSTEKAITLGCRLITTKDVKLQRTHNNAWLVIGTVILQSPIADGIPYPSFFEPRATI
jgi:hypothetical protein